MSDIGLFDVGVTVPRNVRVDSHTEINEGAFMLTAYCDGEHLLGIFAKPCTKTLRDPSGYAAGEYAENFRIRLGCWEETKVAIDALIIKHTREVDKLTLEEQLEA